MPDPSHDYASRGGLKLEAALETFGIDVTGRVAADLGCSTGGFTDCLLQRGAGHVFAVDTAYGQLAWRLRQDKRVTVLERTNALHLDPPKEAAACSLVVLDLGWTKLERAVPAALRWLQGGSEGSEGGGGGVQGDVIALIKPHYESGQHRLEDDEADRVTRGVLEALPPLGVEVRGVIRSPIRGGKGGNLEHLAHLRRVVTARA